MYNFCHSLYFTPQVRVKMLITVRSTHGPAGLDRFPKGHANVRVVIATTINTPDTTLGTTTAMVSQAFVETESTTTETGVSQLYGVRRLIW